MIKKVLGLALGGLLFIGSVEAIAKGPYAGSGAGAGGGMGQGKMYRYQGSMQDRGQVLQQQDQLRQQDQQRIQKRDRIRDPQTHQSTTPSTSQ